LSEEDDFDIVHDDEGTAASRTWLWVGITAIVALFAFGVGAAVMILSNRMGPGLPTPTPSLVVVAPTQVAAITGTVTITQNAPITVSRTPTVTPTVTVSPTPNPTATPFCTQPVETVFIPYFSQERLGCAANSAATIWAAYQSFERGSMLWRSDRDTSYVFYSAGSWFPITQGWDGGPSADRGAPPPGLQAPQRGFGWVWSHDDNIFNGLGWARDQEKGFCALVQDFEHGFILQSTDVASCTPENLYNFATASDWQPLVIAAVDDSQWGSAPLPPAVPATASPAKTPAAQQGNKPPESTLTRPAPNGVYQAFNASGFTIDGNLDEWPDSWIPMNAIVYGADRHTGPGDLSANFQVGWTENGLLLGVRVNDDVYHAGPAGTNLWMGDSIEVQFDRELTEDFNATKADADDYQVGIAFDDDLTEVHGYLWLPFARETDLSMPSAITINAQGYQIEFLIPWYVFELSETPPMDRAYGFNISVNDDDINTDTQQTVLSASPARTTHDNPTQWGTLRLVR
jgi:hypothetical protein